MHKLVKVDLSFLLNLGIPMPKSSARAGIHGMLKPADGDDVARKIESILSRCDDGRQRFAVEKLREALAEVVQEAVRGVFYDKMSRRYRNQMVDMGNQSKMSRAAIETGKATENLKVAVYGIGHESCPSVVEVSDEEVHGK